MRGGIKGCRQNRTWMTLAVQGERNFVVLLQQVGVLQQLVRLRVVPEMYDEGTAARRAAVLVQVRG